jgi:Subunit ChlI of Mg-chelatase
VVRVRVRVWGVAGERLVEVRVAPASGGAGLVVTGLGETRVRTTSDRVRAALVNSGLVAEAPDATVHVDGAGSVGEPSILDLPIALAALTLTGRVGCGLRWIAANGRLGLDGTVFGPEPGGRHSLRDVVLECQTPLLEFEQVFVFGEGRG